MAIELDGLFGITSSGNITTGNYFIGNGYYLTDVTSSYTDANVIALLASGTVPAANVGSIYSNNYFYANGTPFISGGVAVSDQQIAGTGNASYTLNQTTTANSIIVSINGLQQYPTTSYTITGNTITFASAVSNTSVIDIRYFTSSGNGSSNYSDANVAAYLPTYTGDLGAPNTTPVNAIYTDNYFYANGNPYISGNYGNANVQSFLSAAALSSDIIPNGNAVQSLGNSTNQWKDLWLSGNTLYMNQTPISLLPGNVLQIGGSNVLTTATGGNIDCTANVNANGLTINGNATITGNALIQGTLTYNDITNLTTSNLVLSLGNNQSGIAVSGGGITVGSTDEAQWLYNQPNQTWDTDLGIAAVGNITGGNINTVGNVAGTYIIGDGSQLTNLPVSGSGTYQATASSDLVAGDRVIVNPDGTVSVVTQQSQVIGSPTTALSGTYVMPCGVYDTANQRIIVAFRNGSNGDGTIRVGEIVGNTVTFASTSIFSNSDVDSISIAYVTSTGQFVVTYRDRSSGMRWKARLGKLTLPAGSIAFGTEELLSSAATTDSGATVGSLSATVYDPVNDNIFFIFRNGDAGNNGTARTGKVSANFINLIGGVTTFLAAPVISVNAVYDPVNQAIVIACMNDNSKSGVVVAGTLDTFAATFGTPVEFATGQYVFPGQPCYDTINQKVFVPFNWIRSGNNDNYASAVAVTVTGSSVSVGGIATAYSDDTFWSGSAYDSASKRIVMLFQTSSPSNTVRVAYATISGTNISFGGVTQVSADQTQGVNIVYDPVAKRSLGLYAIQSTSVMGFVYLPPISSTLTAENYIGISAGNCTSGNTATVQIVGSVNTNQSGLTPGQSYYVQLNGTLGQTPASPSVFAGTAVAATKIIVKG